MTPLDSGIVAKCYWYATEAIYECYRNIWPLAYPQKSRRCHSESSEIDIRDIFYSACQKGTVSQGLRVILGVAGNKMLPRCCMLRAQQWIIWCPSRQPQASWNTWSCYPQRSHCKNNWFDGDENVFPEKKNNLVWRKKTLRRTAFTVPRTKALTMNSCLVGIIPVTKSVKDTGTHS